MEIYSLGNLVLGLLWIWLAVFINNNNGETIVVILSVFMGLVSILKSIG